MTVDASLQPCQICLETDALFVQSTQVEGDNTDHKIHAARFHVKCIGNWIQESPEASCPLCRKRITHVNGVETKFFLLDHFIHRVFPDAPTLPPASAFAPLEEAAKGFFSRNSAGSSFRESLNLKNAEEAIAGLGRFMLKAGKLPMPSSPGETDPVIRVSFSLLVSFIRRPVTSLALVFHESNPIPVDDTPDEANARAVLDYTASAVFSTTNDLGKIFSGTVVRDDATVEKAIAAAAVALDLTKFAPHTVLRALTVALRQSQPRPPL